MKIAEVSIRRPVLAGVMNAVLLVVGLVAFPAVGIDMFPDVDFPVVTVTTVYPGADPGAVESKVVDKLEEPINTIGGIRQLQSFCLENVGQIVVMFELEQNVDQMAQEVRDKVATALRNLPTDAEQPVIAKFDVGSAPIVSVALAGEKPLREVYKYADDVIKTRLQQINGVGSIDIVGGQEEEVQVWVSPDKLASYYLTINDLAQALGAQNLEVPGGRLTAGGKEFAVKTKGEVHSAEALGDIVITSFQGAPIHVRDVARIEDGTAEERSASNLDGTRAVAIVVRKQSGENTVAVAHRVKSEIAKMQTELPEGMTLAVPTDNSLFIEASVNDAQFDLLLGAILTVLIIMFFLRDWRATIIAAIALPTSVIATVGFIYVMGYTFNMVTMMALTLSIGMLIDDAIVVIENIHRHLEMGKTAKQAAYEGTAEIGLAVMAITASILAVFLPVANMSGMIGRFFVQFGMTVSFAVAVSLLVSFTVTPMLSSRVLKPMHGVKQNFVFRGIEWFLVGLDRIYRRLLAVVLRQRALTILAALGVFAGSILMASRLPQEFMPPQDQGEFKVLFELPSGTTIERSKAFAAELRKELAEVPGVVSQFTTIGGGAQGRVNKGEIHVNLVPRSERAFTTPEMMEYVRELLGERPPAILALSEIDIVGGDSGFRTAAVQFNIRGSDFDEMNQAANALVEQLRAVGGYVDLDNTYRGGNPELSVTIDRDRAAELGVPVAIIAMSIRTLIAGAKVTDLPREGDRIDVRVRVAEQFRRNAQDLLNIKVRSTSGQLVELSQVVKIDEGTGPGQIDRQSRMRQVTVLANLENKPLGTAMQEVESAAESIVPEHLTTSWGGEAQFMAESFNDMFVALALAVILIYMLLAAQFESLIHPFTIMLSLPLSAIGALGALFLFGHPMSIFSMIGFIMLMGLVTKNAVLLVDYTNTLRSRGLDKTAALLEAGPVRLRPILMTTAAMIFGMLPVALGRSLGGEMRAPMAIGVIGGLITSTLLTLLVVPVIYSLLDRFTLKKDRTADQPLTTSPATPAATP
ncbi:MAG: efflux RND transporter permease subunit [Deltaproteobacteria bacterium]|jgi:HAE1 family hydrophobic/amphiphilic exporter-1|nr:efflux RND transporter permease subunit [Deltaproteobacteria bacterium]MBW2535976.1 efflux RND transporter permease subunit [Deltaproteobacteria bacterium]